MGRGVPRRALRQGVELGEDRPVQRAQAPLLGQVRGFLRAHGIAPRPGADTAGSAAAVKAGGDPSVAALASELAGEIHGL